MPKMKTHSGIKKRIKVTKSGKLTRRKANRNHLLEHKPSTRTRRLAGMTEISKADRKQVRSLHGK